MAAPTITSVISRWKINKEHRFHVTGTNFDQTTLIDLHDDRADWAPAAIEKAYSDDKNLVFESHPIKLHKKDHGPGSLTITITNPGFAPARQDVSGSYEA